MKLIDEYGEVPEKEIADKLRWIEEFKMWVTIISAKSDGSVWDYYKVYFRSSEAAIDFVRWQKDICFMRDDL